MRIRGEPADGNIAARYQMSVVSADTLEEQLTKVTTAARRKEETSRRRGLSDSLLSGVLRDPIRPPWAAGFKASVCGHFSAEQERVNRFARPPGGLAVARQGVDALGVSDDLDAAKYVSFRPPKPRARPKPLRGEGEL